MKTTKIALINKKFEASQDGSISDSEEKELLDAILNFNSETNVDKSFSYLFNYFRKNCNDYKMYNITESDFDPDDFEDKEYKEGVKIFDSFRAKNKKDPSKIIKISPPNINERKSLVGVFLMNVSTREIIGAYKSIMSAPCFLAGILKK